jgi:cytidine deaminase
MSLDEQLVAAAKKAANEAYAPYSGFAVGAALLTADGLVYTGANVENASYGLTLCAERAALVKAVTEGQRDFTKLVVYAASEKLPYPCGACLQALAEFAPALEIVVANDAGSDTMNLADLLPRPFRLDADECGDAGEA